MLYAALPLESEAATDETALASTVVVEPRLLGVETPQSFAVKEA